MNLKLKRTIPEINHMGKEALGYELIDSKFTQKAIRVYTPYYKASAMLKAAILNVQYCSTCRFFIKTIWSK